MQQFEGKTKEQIIKDTDAKTGKLCGVLNSWGEEVGDKGWQWLSEEWFKNPKLGVREGWTMAWDYRPAATKVILKKIIKNLQEVVKLYKQILNKY